VPPTASYAIDSDDRIVWTDEGFANLARDHGCADLPERAIGRPLLDFVAGDRPKALQEALLARVRACAPDTLELRYRCDGPEMRRFGVLEIAADSDGAVVFTTWFETVEERAYQPLLDYDRPRGEATAQLCAWCNRFDAGGGWREAEEAAERVAQADSGPPRVEHGLCEICELLLTTRPGEAPKRSFPYGLP
jgi:hypothetical protein